METKAYFEKVMQDYNQNRKGCNLSIIQMKALNKWLVEYRRNMVPVRTVLVGGAVFQGVFKVKNGRLALFHQIIC